MIFMKLLKKTLLFAGASAFVMSAFALDVSIDTSKKFQRIDHFTASDAWSGNFVGQYFDEPQKAQAAKWLFSSKMDKSGNPEGIGLSMWRVNAGGGSLEQDGADIKHYQRRAESFLTKDGKAFDWGKCAGQQYFMRKARDYGCNNFLIFSNTPPVQMTLNGKGYGDGSTKSNLKPECYGKFADFLADIALHFQNEGFNIRYISPINEPHAIWSDVQGQEGSPWRLADMKKVAVELDRSIAERKLDNTKIILGEHSHLVYTYGELNWTKWKEAPETRPIFAVKNFFDKSSPHYVLYLKSMAAVCPAHSYHTHFNNADMKAIRLRVAEECKKYGVEYQQTEWCMLPKQWWKSEQEGIDKDWYSDNHTDIQVSLVMARIIHSDLVYGNATAWGYWKAMEVKGDYALLGVYPTDGNLHHGGVMRANKLLWALGNYSLFVRPDYKRVELSGADDLSTVVASAYVSPDGKKIVAVFVNSSYKTESANLILANGEKLENAEFFVTNSACDLARMPAPELKKVQIPARSICTLVLNLK